MREIKFRAWDKKAKQMLNVDFLSADVKDNTMTIVSACNEHHAIVATKPEYKENFILMQYTGLKDKNGKEIYEGDILKDDTKTFEVKWSNCYARYMAWKNSNCLFYLNEPMDRKRDTKEMKIIGNIYENPELLKRQVINEKPIRPI